jgi:hypothetical protein
MCIRMAEKIMTFCYRRPPCLCRRKFRGVAVTQCAPVAQCPSSPTTENGFSRPWCVLRCHCQLKDERLALLTSESKCRSTKYVRKCVL